MNKFRFGLVFFIFFLGMYPISSTYSFEVTPYYGFSIKDEGNFGLSRGTVNSESPRSTYFGLMLGPEFFSGSAGLDLTYYAPTVTFSDQALARNTKKEFVGTYLSLYGTYGFFPKDKKEYWLKVFFSFPFFASLKPLKTDEDHFFSPSGFSLGGGVNIYKNIYLNFRYSSFEYEKYFANGSAVSTYQSNYKTTQIFSFLSFKF
ncbi:MAG: hypothetical protein CME61_06325 [Halobacteriovoraceae bacterium]|nr:hypothetical protein [Halobacteriovoraceae bacterium]